MLKVLLSGIVYLAFLVFGGMLCFLFSPFFLEYLFVASLLMITFIILVYFDLFILSFISAYEIIPSSFVANRFNNQSCLMGCKNVRIFLTTKLSNIYIIHSLFRSPVVIISEQLLGKLDIVEIDSLISLTLSEIKNRTAKKKTIRIVLLAPLLIISMIFSRKQASTDFSFFHVFSLLFILPIDLIKSFTNIDYKTTILDQSIQASILNKVIRNIPIVKLSSIYEWFFREIAIFPIGSYNLWDSLFSCANRSNYLVDKKSL